MRFRLFFGGLALAGLSVAVWAGQEMRPEAPKASSGQLKGAREEFRAGQRAEGKGDWALAFSFYGRAVHDWPGNASYRLRESLARFHLVQARVYEGEGDAAAGRLEEAREKLESALTLEPSYPVAQQRLQEIDQMLARGPELVPGSIPSLPHLEPRPGTRKFDYEGDVEGLYREIARQFGLAAAFDAQLPQAAIRFRVNGVDFPTAMRLAGEMTGTFWRALTPRLFFVTTNTPEKVEKYGPSVARTVVLEASQSPSEMEQTARVVRSIAEITKTQLDVATHTLTLRGPPDRVALAAALVGEIEQPRGEILLELDILDVNRKLAEQLGITPPSTAQAFSISPSEIRQAEGSLSGLVDAITQTFGQPSALSGIPASQLEALLGSGQLNVASLIPPLVAFGGGQTTFLATLPGAVAQLGETLNLVRSGEQMMLRAEDGEPATLFVGDRFPVSLNRYANALGAQQPFVPQVNSSSFPRSDFPAGSKPAAIAAGDFNGDGYRDLAVANEGDNTVSILLNDGSGSFTAGEVISVAAGPAAIVAGDFNGDGKEDLAVASRDANLVSILTGNGDGTFSITDEIAVDRGPVALVTGDFNGDGKTDLAVASSAADSVSILIGNGDGTFQAPLDLPAGTTPVALASGDFNGEGHTDLAVVNQGDNDVLILLGAGDGTFRRGGSFSTGAKPVSVAAADFNADGLTDLAVANENDNTVSILLGNGDGTFRSKIDFQTGAGPVAVLAADFNSDGLPDLAIANENDDTVSVLVNSGNANFGVRLDVPVAQIPDALASADFDKNGLPDLAIANQGSNSVSVILNDAHLVPSAQASQLTPYPAFQYVDLGLKVTVTPYLHPGGTVTLDMKAQIQGLTGQEVDQVPVLSNRQVEQTARVQYGQATLLVSLRQEQEALTLTGWPGLAALGGRNRQNQDDEIVVIVRPHLVRMPEHKSETLSAGVGSR